MRQCEIEGCVRRHKARGWCNTHYERWRRHGDTDTTLVKQAPPLERFIEKVEVGPCGNCGRHRFEANPCDCDNPDFDNPNTVAGRGDTMHPTVKPLDLMRWLVRLVTPPGGTVLDPFAGTGTTGEACVIEGFDSVLIEQSADYCELAVRRLTKPLQPTLGGAV